MAKESTKKKPNNLPVVSMIGGSVKAIVTTNYGLTTKGSTDTQNSDSSEYALWGDANQWPEITRKHVKSNTILSGALPFKADMLTAGGIAVGKLEEGDDGKVYYNETLSEEWEEWIKDWDINLFLKEVAIDLWTYGSAFPQVVMNKVDKKIAYLSCRRTRARNCRISKQDKKTGNFKHLHVSSEFQDGGTPTESDILKIPLIPTDYRPQDWVKTAADNGAEQLAYRMIIPDLGNSYYPLPFWYSAVESGWLDVANQIVSLRQQIVKNQVQIKYHIVIHADYWPLKFGKDTWEGWSKTERESQAKTVSDGISEFLNDPDNAEGYLMTGSVDWDNHYNKAEVKELVKITPFDIDYPDGIFQADSQEATLHLLAAMCMHPSIFGALPGKNMGGGSGSENRVAYDQRTILMVSYQNIITRIFDLVRDVNGWDTKLRFRMRNSVVLTLDEGNTSEPKAEGAAPEKKKTIEKDEE